VPQNHARLLHGFTDASLQAGVAVQAAVAAFANVCLKTMRDCCMVLRMPPFKQAWLFKQPLLHDAWLV